MLALMRLKRRGVNTLKQAGGLREFAVEPGCRLVAADALLCGNTWKPVPNEALVKYPCATALFNSPCQMPGRVKGREWQLACPWGLAPGRIESRRKPLQTQMGARVLGGSPAQQVKSYKKYAPDSPPN
jgi:hypothetical protein